LSAARRRLQAPRGCRPRPRNAGSIPQKRRTVAGAGPRNAGIYPRRNATVPAQRRIIRAKTPRG